ncbi:MAG: PAS domain S-box protein [Eubacteriales bacterium]
MESKEIKILSIDDNQDNLVSIKALIKEAFPEALIFSALSGQKGLALAVSEVPDVILLDIVMPGMDGFEVCRRLKADSTLSEIPVVFVTAIRDDKESRITALDVGADAFLAKPIDESELTAQIRAMFKIRTANIRNREEKERLASLVEAKTKELNTAHTETLHILEDLKKENEAREKSEKSLLQSEEKFELLFNKAPLGYQSLDSNGCFLEVNQQWLDTLGYERDEVIGKWFGDFLSPAYQDGFRVRFPIFKAQGFIHSEFEMVRKNSERLFIAFDGRIGYDANGDFKQTHCILQDITERRRASAALAISEKRFKHISEITSDISYSCIAVDGGSYSLDWIAGAICEITGYTSEEIMAHGCWRFLVHEEDTAVFEANINNLAAGAKSSCEMRIRHKNGHPIWISSFAECILDPEIPGRLELYGGLVDINEAKVMQEELRESENKYRRLFETMSQGVVYQDTDGGIIFANPAAERILGFSVDTMQGKTSMDPSWKTINEDGSPLSGYDHPAMIALRTGRPFGPFVMGVFQPQINDHVWLSVNATPLFRPGESKPYQVYVIIGDITAEHKANRKYESLFREMVDAFALHEIICDEYGNPVDYRYLSVNPAFERMTGLRAENIIGRTILEILPDTERYWIETYGRVALTGEPASFENFTASLDKYFTVSAYQPAPNQFACTFTDITERKKAEDDLVYLSSHDQLTGLYNRRYFEDKFKKMDTKNNLPITVAMGDINGLKLINDSFGHFVGDELLIKASDVIKKECRKNDLLARIGGDEFAVVFPRTDASEATQIINSIQKKAANEKVANVALSISFGYDTKGKEEQTIFEVLANAENHMYRHKISERSSMRSNTIDIIINTLFEKSNRESLHSKRVSQICQAIAANMDFEKDDISQITMAGLVHDIGKIGVDEKILNKPGKLDNNEWEEMKKHPETGWRILSATNEFSELAQFILEHHEKWDGKGYPNGLKGEEIAVEARIIAVADAYDAMTRDRSYRKGFSKDEAAVEIRRCSGTQFDPAIADVFVNKVLPNAIDF